MLCAFDLSLRHLDAVVAVTQQGSISGASVSVNMSQPALTQALAKLEAQVGHRLFERQARGVHPTPAGDLFLQRVERALQRIVDGGRRIPRAPRLTPLAHLQRMVSMGQLRALSALERAGSYVLAAQELGLSQPTVHRAVKDLEALIEVPLVLRAGRVVRLTPEAVRLVSAIRLMAAELDAGLDELNALTLQGAGRVAIGALQLPRVRLLPAALASFMRQYAQAAVRVVEGHYGELLGQVRTGELDMMVGALREPPPTQDVQQIALFSDVLHVVARTEHPLMKLRTRRLSELRSYPWVVGAKGAPMRSVWERLFAGVDYPMVTVECSSILAARALLLQGDWLALMSPEHFSLERDLGLLVPIGAAVEGSRRSIGITTRSDFLPTAAQSAFIAALQVAASVRSCES